MGVSRRESSSKGGHPGPQEPGNPTYYFKGSAPVMVGREEANSLVAPWTGRRQRTRQPKTRLVSSGGDWYISAQSAKQHHTAVPEGHSLFYDENFVARASVRIFILRSPRASPRPHQTDSPRSPEIRTLIGPAPFTFWCILGLVGLQFGVAWFVADRPMWLVLVLAYTVGAFASHGLFVMIHECAHRLVFRRRRPNVLAGLFANLPLFVPGSFSFQKYHLKHHSNQGVYELDADIPSEWEARLVGRSALRKALWLLLYPLFQTVRSFRVKEVPPLDAWTLTNLAIRSASTWPCI